MARQDRIVRRFACSERANTGFWAARRNLGFATSEELQALDALNRKLALPAPDGPQNQIESNPAIEAIEVESEACDVNGSLAPLPNADRG